MKKPQLIAAMGIVSFVLAGATAQAQKYSMTDLGGLGSAGSVGYAINDAGQVTGSSENSSSQVHAFLYSNGKMTDIGTAGQTSVGYAINPSGQIAGSANPLGGSTEEIAFLYANGVMSGLGTLPGGVFSVAYGINGKGEVTGYSGGSKSSAAFTYSAGQMTGFGGASSVGYDVNASGQVTGQYIDKAGYTRAFIFSGGTLTGLGTLGGLYSYGYAINNGGQVTGYSSLPHPTGSGPLLQHAFLYSSGAMQDLGTLPGGTFSAGYGINVRGSVVGTSNLSGTTTSHGFLYAAGVMSDLNTLVEGDLAAIGVTLEIGQAINDYGWIVANGNNGHAYLLEPISASGHRDTP
jgi:probable HAF family extracellular repeat protein